jgi:hypothetical protein
MVLYLLSPFYSLSHNSRTQTQSFTKVPKKDGAVSALAILQPLSQLLHANTILYESPKKRWRCICSRNSSTASLTTPYMQATQSSPLPTCNTILYESLKKMALYLFSQFLHSLSHHYLHATQSFTKVSKRWRCMCSRNSSTASLTTPYMQATQSFTKVSKRWRAVSALAIPPQPLSPLPKCNTILYKNLKTLALHLL